MTDDVIDLADPAVARHYDELPLWSAPFGLMLLDRVPLRPGLTYVDIGAGTGFLSVELAQRGGIDARVIAVDPWTPAMDVLRDKCDYLGLHNVELVESDAARTGLPDASADVIVSNLGVNNFDDPAAVLAECRRIARPGGRLVITSNLVGHMAEFYEVFAETLRAVGADVRLPALRADIEHRATVESATAQIDAAGFRVEHVERDTFRLRFADGRALLRHYFIRLGFLPQWRAVMGDDAATITADLVRRLDQRAADRDGLALTIPMACLDAVAI